MDTILPPELVEAARKVLEANRAAGRRVAVAESCTGGLVSAALTEIPGSSDVFDAGFVTYSNQAKHDVLKVGSDVLETFGSVSIAVAWSMAQGALARTQADVAVAITGIAGPDGGSELNFGRKPSVCKAIETEVRILRSSSTSAIVAVMRVRHSDPLIQRRNRNFFAAQSADNVYSG